MATFILQGVATNCAECQKKPLQNRYDFSEALLIQVWQRFCKPQVVGSTPTAGSIFEVFKRLITNGLMMK
jgi:uncharacterized protein (DUF2062 family)